MAAPPAQQLLLAERSCALCPERLTDPASLPCGHRFCRGCGARGWAGRSAALPCPECRDTSSPRGSLQPSRPLSHIAHAARRPSLEPAPAPGLGSVCDRHGEALKVFCQKDQTPVCVVCLLARDHRDHPAVPLEEAAEDYQDQIRSRLESLKKNREAILSFKLSGENKSQELLKQLETERQKIVSEFQLLRQFLEEQEQFLLAQLEELKKEIEKGRAEYVAKLSEELSSFSSLISEMEQKCQQPAREFLQDIKGTLSRCEREKFQNPVAFSSDLKWRIWESSQRNASLETIMRTFKDSLLSRQRLDKGKFLGSKANVTLDPDTAHPELILSADRRSVRYGDTRQDLADNPERFDTMCCVLGCEGFTVGRRYWEVGVEVGGVWGVGVARASVRRKGRISLYPEQGIWAVQCWEDQYRAPTSPAQSIRFSPSSAPRRIRVFLDCERGQVTFFDADTWDLIVTFSPASFAGERIHPLFWAGSSAGLTLCP